MLGNSFASRLLLSFVFLALFGLSLGAATRITAFEKSTLIIDTVAGPRRFAIELAVSPREQEQGLMFRRKLAPDAGMLFDFGAVRPAAFWMHDTPLSLDMLFIAANGRIADIHEGATPMSDAIIVSKVPVRAGLELAGGTVGRLGIRVGDVVHYQIFGTAPRD